MGFPVPLGAWLRGRYRNVVNEYVLGERAAGRGIFDRDFVRGLAAEHLRGERDHSSRLWSLINFEIWLRQFIDGERGSEPQPMRAKASLVTSTPASF